MPRLDLAFALFFFAALVLDVVVFLGLVFLFLFLVELGIAVLHFDPGVGEVRLEELEELVDLVARPLVEDVGEELVEVPAVDSTLDLLDLLVVEPFDDVLAEGVGVTLFDGIVRGQPNLPDGALGEVHFHRMSDLDLGLTARAIYWGHRPVNDLISMASLRTASIVLAVASACSTAVAQPDERPSHVVPPPAPEHREPELIAQIHLGTVIPLERTDICPGDSLCVLGAGATTGVEIERRWPFGLGILVAYDLWFVDSGGVFELGVVQIVRAALQYVFLDDLMVHPAIHLGAGALVFGDTGLVSTVGGAIEGGASAEIELTDIVAITFAAQAWLFTTSPFTTGRDRTPRSEGLGINVALQLNIGLSILAQSSVR